MLGDGVETERYLALAREIAAQVGNRGLRTLFRPHPMERERIRSLRPAGIDIT